MEAGFLQGLPFRVVSGLVLHWPVDGDSLLEVNILPNIRSHIR